MAGVGLARTAGSSDDKSRPTSRLTRLAASRGFQRWAARVPVLQRIVRSEGEAMFDLVAGFCHSQILQALVRLKIPEKLLHSEMHDEALARDVEVPLERMRVLLSGGMAIGVLKRCRSGHYALTMRGAAMAGVPGLSGMISHHDVLYRDLADPVAFFRGEVETELAGFWPYVFGAASAKDSRVAATYSKLMADSQTLVAEDTLAVANMSGVRHLLDVGGGTGAFLAAVGTAYPALSLTLFDLPSVAPAAKDRFAESGMADRTTVCSGSFRRDILPEGADMISLVRVLYDHSDETVLALLKSAYSALPAGGRILISEPMTGGANPTRAGDAYFALYCMAMRTGRARSVAQISALLEQAGFHCVYAPSVPRPFITSVVQGVRPD